MTHHRSLHGRAAWAATVLVCAWLGGCGRVKAVPDAGQSGTIDATPGKDAGMDAGMADGGVSDFSLALAQPSALVRQGAQQTVQVTITRAAGFSGDVSVGVNSLPSGVTADPLTVGAASTTGTLVLHAASTAPQGAASVEVAASAGTVMHTRPLRLLVAGQPGSLDMSFGNGGMVATSVPGAVTIGRGIAVQQDGRIVVTGSTNTQAVTARFNPNGSLDSSFGSGGIVTTGLSKFAEGIGVTVLPDGHVIVAGTSGDNSAGDLDFTLFAYSSAGALDTGFGSGGTVTSNPGTNVAELHSVAQASSGALIVSGAVFASATSGRGLSYSDTGQQNTSFAISEAGVAFESQRIQNDGKILLAGGKSSDFWLGRFNSDGSADTTFGTSGATTTTFGSLSSTAYGIAIVSGGKIVAAGTGTTSSGAISPVLARYNANGSIDLTFGSMGTVTTTADFSTRAPDAIVVDADGHILLAGASGSAPGVMRFGSDGSIDSGFGTGGIATADFGIGSTQNTGSYGIAIDADGRILISGEAGSAGSQRMILARFWP